MATFDHLAVSAATLDEGVAHVEAAIGHPMGPGGRHALMSTHNRLLGLDDGGYLEVIAVDPDAPDPGRPRWFGLDRRAGPPRVETWIARVDDLDAALARLPLAGAPVALSRGALRWRMAVPEDGAPPFDGCFPALIEWETPPPSFPPSGLTLARLTLRHPEAETLRPLLAGLTRDPRLTLEAGPRLIEAEIATPSGTRRLA
jgi:hypothetical protein